MIKRIFILFLVLKVDLRTIGNHLFFELESELHDQRIPGATGLSLQFMLKQ